MKKNIALAACAFMLFACSSIPYDPNWRPDMTNAEFGQYPTNYPTIVKTWGEEFFDENSSINYLSISTPREEYLVTDSEKQQAIYGFSVCTNISGIKSEGYFKPFKKYWLFIRDGEVVEARDLEYGYNKVIYREHTVNCDDAN